MVSVKNGYFRIHSFTPVRITHSLSSGTWIRRDIRSNRETKNLSRLEVASIRCGNHRMKGRGGEGEEFEELDGEESLLDSGLNELGDTT